MADNKPLLDSSDSENEHNPIDMYGSPKRNLPYQNKVIHFKEISKIIKKGNIEKLKECLKERNIELYDDETTVVHVAAGCDNVEKLNLLLRQKRCWALLNRQNQCGATPLITAVQSKSYKTLDLLCRLGADPTKVIFKTGQNVLHLSGLAHDSQAANILLTYNSSPEFINWVDVGGDTPLTESARVKSPVFDLLLAAGADILVQNPENGRTILHVTVAYNRHSILKKTLDHPKASFAFAEVRDIQGDSPLMVAVKLRRLELIKILTNAYKNLDGINNIEKISILHIAVENGRVDMLNHLLTETSLKSLDYLDSEQRTPLLVAAQLNHQKCLQELIEHGADWHKTNLDSGETIMHVIAKHHSDACITYLMSLDHVSWFFNQKDREDNTPYMSAIKSGNDFFLRESLKVMKVDLTDYNSDGETALFYTLKQGYLSVMLALLLSPKYYWFARHNRKKVDLSDNNEILKAEIRGDIYATDVFILLKKIIKHPLVRWFPPALLLKSDRNRSLFHACALGGNLECLQFLDTFYKLFAPKYFMDDFDSPDDLGNTPLLLAAQCGASVSCARYFIINGANLCATNNEGLNVIKAIFLYNPDSVCLICGILNHCVSAQNKHYSYERLNIKVDLSMLCPPGLNQMKVVDLFFKETKENDRRKILQHPVINILIRKKHRAMRGIFYVKLSAALISCIIVSATTPILFVSEQDPVKNFGWLTVTLLQIVWICIVFWSVVHSILKIQQVRHNDVFCSEILGVLLPIFLTTLLLCNRSFYFVPEIAAASILALWSCLFNYIIYAQTTLSYQISMYNTLLYNIQSHLLMFFVIMFAFSLSFFCLYHRDENFENFPKSFVYTFSVLLPGYISGLPTFETEYFKASPINLNFFVECAIAGAFIIIAVFSFVNMLVGLAVRSGKHLEIDGMISHNHYKTHLMFGVEEYIFRSNLFYWLLRKDMWRSFLEKLKKNIMIGTTINIYDEENKNIIDDTLIRRFRSIVFQQRKYGKSNPKEKAAEALLVEDCFGNPSCTTGNKITP